MSKRVNGLFLLCLLATVITRPSLVGGRQVALENDPPTLESFPAKNPACPCINSSIPLLAFSNCKIDMSKTNARHRFSISESNATMATPATVEPGILVNGRCYPISTYGSNVCAPHDMLVDPACSPDLAPEQRLPYCVGWTWTNVVTRTNCFIEPTPIYWEDRNTIATNHSYTTRIRHVEDLQMNGSTLPQP